MDRNYSNVAYAMDCAGFVSSAISAGASLFAGDLKASASAALKLNTSLLAAHAQVASPIAMALQPDSFATRLPAQDRISVLYTVLYEMAIVHSAESAALTTWRVADLLWTSRSGSSSFQGKANLNTAATVGFGVASLSGTASASSEFSRDVQYSNFETFVLRDVSSDAVTTTFASARTQLEEAVRYVSTTKAAHKDNANYKVGLDLPENVCALAWTLAPLSAADGVSGTVNGLYEKGSCKLTASQIQGAQNIQTARGFMLKATNLFGGKGFEIRVVIP
jgi:hypothetical protein